MTRVVERISAAFLKQQVSDPWLRRQLTPDFRIGCKRVLMSSEYYPALQKPNCKLITWPIATISPKGIRTAEGVEHQVDCIVFATGFEVSKAGTPFTIRGIQGRVLAEEWARGAQAYKSVNVSGYPNLSFILGPNSGPGHNSALVYMESQIGYIVGNHLAACATRACACWMSNPRCRRSTTARSRSAWHAPTGTPAARAGT